MNFRDPLKENYWFGLLSFEYERYVRDLLLESLNDGTLAFSVIGSASVQEKEKFLREQATPFVCLSVRQSKELFVSAEQVSDVTKPLLSYYAILNLAKGLMALDLPDFFTDRSNLSHGLSVKESTPHHFQYESEGVILFSKGVYPLGRVALGQPPICAENEKVIVKLDDILKGLPELYWDYQKVADATPENMNCFHFGVPDSKYDAYSQEFYADTYIDKKVFQGIRSRLPIDLDEHFKFEESGPSFCLKTKLKSGVIQDLVDLLNQFSTVLMAANNVRFIILKFDCQVEGSSGSKSVGVAFTELELIYLLSFYMGHVARYRPHIWEAIMSGRETKYVTVFKRFLYNSDAKFIGLAALRTSAA